MSKSKNFEESLESLEAIVKALENGDLPLEEAVKKYQEGMKLSAHCHGLLKDADKVLTTLMKDNQEESFDIDSHKDE